MNAIKTISRTIAAIVLLTITFTSCKKDSATTPTTVSGSASANFRTASSGAATDVTFNSAVFTNAAGVVDIVATNAAGQKLTLHVTGVTAAGTFTLTGSNFGAFLTGGTTYITNGPTVGGGNVIITTLTADKVEGTFLLEAFAGTVYASLSSGKFTAGK